jgi:hypothetical protein
LKTILSILLLSSYLFATHTKYIFGFEYGTTKSSYHTKIQNSEDDYAKDSSQERLRGFKMGLSLNSHERVYLSYNYSDFKTKLLDEKERIYLFNYDYLFDLDYARLKPFLGFSMGKYTSTSIDFLGKLQNIYGLNMGLVFHVNRFIDIDFGYKYITDLKFNDSRLESTITKDNISYNRRFDSIQHCYADMVLKF